MKNAPDNSSAKLIELIKDIRVAFLVTTASRGIHPRPMYTRPIDVETFSGELFFFTDDTSDMIGEIAANPRVAITYANSSHNHYLCVIGDAIAEKDPQKASELWSLFAKAWWPDGPHSPTLAIIRVRIVEAEYWDGPSNTSYALSMAKALLTQQKIHLDIEHGRLRGT